MAYDKRRFSRVNFDVESRLFVEDIEHSVSEILNLSVGGCLLDIDNSFVLDQKCKFIIRLSPTGPDVEIFGKFVRVEPAKVGILFNAISPGNLTHLQNIIRYNAEDPDKIEDEISSRPGLK